MMSRVVEEGTGTAGRARRHHGGGQDRHGRGGRQPRVHAALVHRFAPVDDPQMAIAVTVERTTGQGGTVAAPIAKQVLEALLGGGGG